jgi:hypothetical protein
LFRAKKEAFVLSFQKVLLRATMAFVLVLIPLSLMRKSAVKKAVTDAH